MIKFSILLPCLFFLFAASAQQHQFIYSKEGKIMLNRYNFINNCLRSLHKDRTDPTALSVCECRVNKIDGHFTNSQYKKLGNSDVADLSILIKQEPGFEEELQRCFTSSGKAILLNAEGYKEEFVRNCMQSIQQSTDKKIDTTKVKQFCDCQLNLVTSKQMADTEIKTMNNPNSVLFYEMMYKCGDPFREQTEANRNWNDNLLHDVAGPAIDTVRVLNMDGMTYIKLKTGSLVQFWLFDTGATDLLINTDMEEQLKKEGIITTTNFLGIGNYEMANGSVDTCRKYRLNNVQIGHTTINNIVVAVSSKGKRIIAGKSLLNKFSNWTLDNKNNTLTLSR